MTNLNSASPWTPKLLRAAFATFIGASAWLLAGNAAANGRHEIRQASNAFYGALDVPAAGGEISTSNLGSGGDTVLTVFDSSGNYVTGNDDYGGTLGSRVTIAPAASSRTLYVVVRSYASNAPNTATLSVTSGGQTLSSRSITFGGLQVRTGTTYAAGTQFQTAEVGLGSPDTFIMAFEGNSVRGHLLDDDSGVGRMSFGRLKQACSSCSILVATYPGRTPGAAMLYVDQDVAIGGGDRDQDGLGNGLESQLGTNPDLVDTDGDGLSDGIEVYGVDSSPVMKLPAWGATPLAKDLFVEADWQDAGGTTPDARQLPGNWAEFNARFYAPDIRLHIDNGIENTNPATFTTWGKWGGANRIASFNSYCDGRATGFRRVFHHIILTGTTGGGGQTTPSGCSVASWNSFQHELGHQLGLEHGGADNINCKPHYRSPMNYAYSYDPNISQFSRGERASLLLNPAALDESFGFGPGQSNAWLPASSMGFDVSGQSIDWSRDGRFSSGTTQGAVTWPKGFTDCGVAFIGAEIKHTTNPALVWQRDAADVSKSKFMIIDHNGTDIGSRHTFKSDMDSCTAKNASDACLNFRARTTVPNAIPTTSFKSLHAASYDNDTRVMLVYTVASIVNYQTLSPTGEWSAPLAVGGSPMANSASVMEYPKGVVNVLAPMTNPRFGLRVHHSRYNSASRTWTSSTEARWSDGTTITPSAHPPALAVGYVRDLAGPQLFGLFVDPNTTMVFARYDAAADHWVKYDDAKTWTDFHGAGYEPGLAYRPFDAANPSEGRFYVIYGPSNGAPIAITKTEGNDPNSTTSRRLVFRLNTMLVNEWSFGGNVKMLYQMGLDTNVRQIFAGLGPEGSSYFAALSDGLYNFDYRDYDDYAIMTRNLAGSLVATWP